MGKKVETTLDWGCYEELSASVFLILKFLTFWTLGLIIYEKIDESDVTNNFSEGTTSHCLSPGWNSQWQPPPLQLLKMNMALTPASNGQLQQLPRKSYGLSPTLCSGKVNI